MQPRRLSTNFAYTPRGALQQRIQILKPNPTRDAKGEFLPSVVFAECWAKVEHIQGRDLDKQQQIVTSVTHKITVPYIDGVESDMLVLFDGSLFVIEFADDPDERKVEIWIFAVKWNDGKMGEQ